MRTLIIDPMKRPILELSMIVNNGGAALARCLESARPAVDRILIGDTGSTDDTLEIAARFGAEVVHLPPITVGAGFSEARNAVLEYSAALWNTDPETDWILVLDADEMLDPADAPILRELIEDPAVFAYDIWRWNYVAQTASRCGDEGALPNPHRIPEADNYPAYVRSLSTRLFRRHPGVCFEGPVHETVWFRLKELGLHTAGAPFVIHHFGQAEDTAQVRTSKNEFYQALNRAHFAALPNDAHTCFELGLGELEQFNRPDRAVDLFLRTITLNPFDGVEVANSFLFAGICLTRLGHYSAAMDALARATLILPGSIVLHEAVGDAHFHQGLYADALRAFSAAQSLGETSALLAAKRGLCEVRIGDTGLGVARLKRALAADPAFAELYDVAILGAALAGDVEFAAVAAEQRLALPGASAEQRNMAAALRTLAAQHHHLPIALPPQSHPRQALTGSQPRSVA